MTILASELHICTLKFGPKTDDGVEQPNPHDRDIVWVRPEPDILPKSAPKQGRVKLDHTSFIKVAWCKNTTLVCQNLQGITCEAYSLKDLLGMCSRCRKYVDTKPSTIVLEGSDSMISSRDAGLISTRKIKEPSSSCAVVLGLQFGEGMSSSSK
jgi:hypothetical protein